MSEQLTSPPGTSCARCGKSPAVGFAQVNDNWLCHPDDLDALDCYSLWQYEEKMGRHRSHEERLADVRTNSQNAPTISRQEQRSFDQAMGEEYARLIGDNIPSSELFRRMREQSEGAARVRLVMRDGRWVADGDAPSPR